MAKQAFVIGIGEKFGWLLANGAFGMPSEQVGYRYFDTPDEADTEARSLREAGKFPDGSSGDWDLYLCYL